MNQPCLHPDDLPSPQTIKLSGILFRQLEEATKKNFFLACDRMTRILLSSCHWYFQIIFEACQNIMNQPCLHPDDLPSPQTIKLSGILFRQLEEATKKNFFLAGDRMTRILLSSCHWYFQINSGVLTLIVICNNMKSYRQIMKTVPQFAGHLKQFANRAKITVSSPVDKGIPWVLNIDNSLPEGDLPNT